MNREASGVGMLCCVMAWAIGAADVLIPSNGKTTNGDATAQSAINLTNTVPTFSEAHDKEHGPAERVGTYVLCVRTETNVVTGDNASGCPNYPQCMVQAVFRTDGHNCIPYVSPTEKWAGTNIVRYETYITDQGIRLTRETGQSLPRRVWKLESDWKEVKP
jgi:hypothetical protein